MLKLNLGCGPVQPPGWVNVDGSRRAWVASRLSLLDRLLVRTGIWPQTEFDRHTHYANLLRDWPWGAGSAQAIYLGETLEHFTRDDAVRLLGKCFGVLSSGGVLRLRVPDGARFWANYLREYDAARSRPRGEWGDAHTRWVGMFFEYICVRRPWLGSFGHFHKWMWDDVSLILALERAGFVAVERRAYLDSAIADVAAVEVRDDLIVEGVKP